MDILETNQNDIKVLTVVGRLDTLSSTSLENKLLGIIDDNASDIIIDFSKLDFISSSGLRVLLTAGKKMKNTTSKLVLCALKDHVKEVFDIAGFTMLFTMFTTMDEAIKSFK